MSEKLLIIIVLKGVGESEGKIGSEESTLVPLVSICVIIDVLADPMPTNSLMLLYFVAKTKNFHSVIVKRIWFCKV